VQRNSVRLGRIKPLYKINKRVKQGEGNGNWGAIFEAGARDLIF
jgi:hypothetical protein